MPLFSGFLRDDFKMHYNDVVKEKELLEHIK